jgi:hypothetical protein
MLFELQMLCSGEYGEKMNMNGRKENIWKKL